MRHFAQVKADSIIGGNTGVSGTGIHVGIGIRIGIQIILDRLVSFVIFRIDNIHALLGQDPNQLVKRFGS